MRDVNVPEETQFDFLEIPGEVQMEERGGLKTSHSLNIRNYRGLTVACENREFSVAQQFNYCVEYKSVDFCFSVKQDDTLYDLIH